MKELMEYAIEHFEPEVAVVIILIAYAASGKFDDLDLTVFLDLVDFLADLSNIVGTVVEHYAYEQLEELNEEERKQKVIDDKHMNALREVQEALFQNKDGISLDLTRSSRNVFITPMMPAQYISNSVTEFNLVGFGDFDYSMKYKRLYEPEIMIT
tara:strand:- start:70 stop:534 length:465 start_codon:yes stop_codon:yes gene_type:complete